MAGLRRVEIFQTLEVFEKSAVFRSQSVFGFRKPADRDRGAVVAEICQSPFWDLSDARYGICGG